MENHLFFFARASRGFARKDGFEWLNQSIKIDINLLINYQWPCSSMFNSYVSHYERVFDMTGTAESFHGLERMDRWGSKGRLVQISETDIYNYMENHFFVGKFTQFK